MTTSITYDNQWYHLWQPAALPRRNFKNPLMGCDCPQLYQNLPKPWFPPFNHYCSSIYPHIQHNQWLICFLHPFVSFPSSPSLSIFHFSPLVFPVENRYLPNQTNCSMKIRIACGTQWTAPHFDCPWSWASPFNVRWVAVDQHCLLPLDFICVYGSDPCQLSPPL